MVGSEQIIRSVSRAAEGYKEFAVVMLSGARGVSVGMGMRRERVVALLPRTGDGSGTGLMVRGGPCGLKFSARKRDVLG